MLYKKKSIDGIFNNYVEIEKINIKKKNFSRIQTILGKGNSISQLPFIKNVKTLVLESENQFRIDEKKKLLEVNGNATIGEIHNFLLKRKYFCHYFPSYPLVSVGACIANGVHGFIPKKGIFTDFVEEIKLCNPNFGIKKLSNKKNQKIFNLTKCGLGLTGIILSAKIKIFRLKSTEITIKNYNFKNILNCYKFMKKSKTIYNQNSFTINYSRKNIFLGRLIVGSFKRKIVKYKHIENNKIPKTRLGIFKFKIIKNFFFNFIFLLEKIKISISNKQHINDIMFTSNKRTSYFLFMPKKFIEYQNLIPDSKVKKYLPKFEHLLKMHKPNISLMHLKLFDQNGKNLEFKKKGLAIALHILIDKNFDGFYEKLIQLDFQHNCLINLYKNSLIDEKLLEKFYPNTLKNFKKKIQSINTKYKFSNSIFEKRI